MANISKIVFAFLAASPQAVYAWGCNGHHIIALIAERHLNDHARAAVDALLTADPIDPKLARYCKDEALDPFVSSATWADDAKRGEGTGTWHYIDIPRSLTQGNLTRYCEPAGSVNGGSRTGCVVSALYDQLAILRDRSANDRPRALRYVIHLPGDLHQPLHVSDNGDRGGNCVPLRFGASPRATNLHSLLDSGLVDAALSERGLTAAELAEHLDVRYRKDSEAWGSREADLERWVWEVHHVAIETTCGKLRPAIPVEPTDASSDCAAETAKVRALNIVAGRDYQGAAMEAIEPLFAKAGYRLAGLLNELWP
jgi:S1/P1 Nuclease